MRNDAVIAAVLLVLAAVAIAVPSPAEKAAGRMRVLFGERASAGRAGRWRVRLPARWARPERVEMTAFALELVAACLDAGATPAAALAAAGREAADPLGAALVRAGQAMSSGATTHEAIPEQGPLCTLAAVFRRSAQSGSRMSDQLVGVAAQLRADGHFERLAKAQRVGVLSALPLGLCLLPAFLLLAVVPAVMGLGAGLLG